MLATGTKFGPYEIVGPLGAGGMGEVYRARDTRLDRSVAIKILNSHLSGNAEAKQRFEREARAISTLNHPNVCHLYDIGSQDGTDYLVMEYLDGETLATRLLKGPLPLEQLLKYGMEICDGLEKAHRGGVVHRDLKPANIMLSKAGPKLMDFGLAKSAASATQSSSGLTATVNSPAVSQPLTAEGTVVGTFQYMSPEQLEGNEADSRSDIFALGAVLYEMATGKRAFEGKTPASVIAAVLERNPPPISGTQLASPPSLDRIVRTCLAKDPDQRWSSAHDVKLQLAALREESQSGTKESLQRQTSRAYKFAWPLVALLAAALLWISAVYLRHPVSSALPVRSSILPPANWSFLANNISLSPDGTRLAFTGVGPNGETTLWVRSLSTGGVQQLNGAEGATIPFWSPDSTRIGFFADGKLKTTDANGTGLPKTLADATFGRGGTWNREGTIVFAPDMFGSLYRISENGGVPSPATKQPGTGQAHRWPFFLPDGKHFLFGIDWTAPQETPGNGIYIGSLEGGDPKLITAESPGNAAFASGKLLYVRDLTLLAQPFDLDRLETTGPAAPVSEQQVVTNQSFSNSAFSASQNGVLVFQSVADSASQLVWFSSKGEQIGQVPAALPKDPRLSPDGRFVAFASDEAGNGKSYIRVYDTTRDLSTRLTDSGGHDGPTWSRDGKKLAYVGSDHNTYSIYLIAADASGSPQSFLKAPRMSGVEWPDPGHLLFADFGLGRPRLTVLSLTDQKVTVLHPGAEVRVSPDGHWILYTFSSGRPLRPDVFIEPFPGPSGRIQISRAGGAQGTWSADGKQIFFIAPDKKMMAVTFDAATRTVSAPRVLFQTRIVAPNFTHRQYDVAPDGRFLINSLPPGSAPPITLLTNWTSQKNQ